MRVVERDGQVIVVAERVLGRHVLFNPNHGAGGRFDFGRGAVANVRGKAAAQRHIALIERAAQHQRNQQALMHHQAMASLERDKRGYNERHGVAALRGKVKSEDRALNTLAKAVPHADVRALRGYANAVNARALHLRETGHPQAEEFAHAFGHHVDAVGVLTSRSDYQGGMK